MSPGLISVSRSYLSLPVLSQSPGLISVSRSYLSLPVLSQSPGLISVSRSYLSLPVLSQSPGLISVSRSYLSLPVLSQSPGLVSSPFRYRSRYRFVSLFESTLVPYQHHPISSDAVSVTPSNQCAQVFINLNNLTNSTITITNPDTPLPGLNLALRSVPDSISSK
ncbi:hypothetical protein J132_04476 [Termitomyces sp. J132]|nr:hypothetical protein J132_04476 [Termitomyces sp. J132]